MIAALEATLLAYLRNDLDDLPALRMIRAGAEEIGERARRIAQELKPKLASTQAEIEITEGQSVIGGGSTPGEYLPTRLLRITSAKYSAAQLEARLPKPRSRPRRNAKCGARSGAGANFRGSLGNRSANRVSVAGSRADRGTHGGTRGRSGLSLHYAENRQPEKTRTQRNYCARDLPWLMIFSISSTVRGRRAVSNL